MIKTRECKITIKDLVNGFLDNAENGVVSYSGKLNIRPAYQREFVYKKEQRDAVISTVVKGIPLGYMFWKENDNGTFEIIDGQQRTISICQYLTNVFSIDYFSFENLTTSEKKDIENYEIMVCICKGEDKDILDLFQRINNYGEKLSAQELRNAVYTGPWLSDAKIKFSKIGCVAWNIAKTYIKGALNRQEYLETALKWISNNKINEYMNKHCKDEDAEELWEYFKNTIDWIEKTFKVYRTEMLGLNWGELYALHREQKQDPDELESRIAKLMADVCIKNKKGIYKYVLCGETRELEVRCFEDSVKRSKYEQQQGVCPDCLTKGINKKYNIEDMDADHITAWSNGGKTDISNCIMLCKTHNRSKGNS
ncbi:MAG: DUF262 domain-containing protein [Christensenellaceae bacterium]|jgi:hypothetical protein|nr:DUF262 domain-containing protein [Christensenellaceae bacterium]